MAGLYSRLVVVTLAFALVNGNALRTDEAVVCGGELNAESGQLESPNFPDNYPSNKECIWKISVPEGYQATVQFQAFEVESHDACIYDFVEIRDGHDATSPVLGKYCGYIIPKNITSTSNKLRIKFVTDDSIEGGGFSASFSKAERDECSIIDHKCQHICENILQGHKCNCRHGYKLHSDGKRCVACGEVLNTSNGTIISPNFPEAYPNNEDCIWEIIAPSEHRIYLYFTNFDLEGNNEQCAFDNVAIFSKDLEDRLKKHGVYCGSHLPPLIISDANSLRIEFSSDNVVKKSGFAAVFSTDVDECAVNKGGCQHHCENTIGSFKCSCPNGFKLQENGKTCELNTCVYEITTLGELSTPSHPDYLKGKRDCAWHFTATPGHRINLALDNFKAASSNNDCAYNHIHLYDSENASNGSLSRFCYTTAPHHFIANGSEIYMFFTSGISLQQKGVFGTQSTVCGGTLQATSEMKYFYSHANYKNQLYKDNERCDWVIESRHPHKHITLKFLTLELESHAQCGYDYVDIFSGYTDNSPKLGRFCSNNFPPPIVSSSEALLVRFFSDSGNVGRGFAAVYNIV